MAAAVSDYTPVRPSKTKIKKSEAELAIRLKPTTDILKWAGKNKKHRTVVGFALEDKAVQTRAEKKLKEKNLDMIIANTTAAIGAESSQVRIKCKDSKWIKFPMAAKSTVAGRIIRLLAKN
jgi:phosphopantothenoylcysteine decarboxylase/phosphopantothenate--cysteine ligase